MPVLKSRCRDAPDISVQLLTDANLLSDDRWTYTYDAENRLIAMNSHFANTERYAFSYDYLGRRVRKQAFTWSTSSGGYYSLTDDREFLYDGWNPVAELDGGTTPIREYTWGSDLSGTPQGTGGIGGLLFVNDDVNTYYPGYDGNGNVALLVAAEDGTVAARYEYGPFGEPLTVTGTYMKDLNPFRFSTKYTDPETGLVYFGYRYYDPETGRWITRDPAEEQGGENLYEAFIQIKSDFV